MVNPIPVSEPNDVAQYSFQREHHLGQHDQRAGELDALASRRVPEVALRRPRWAYAMPASRRESQSPVSRTSRPRGEVMLMRFWLSATISLEAPTGSRKADHQKQEREMPALLAS